MSFEDDLLEQADHLLNKDEEPPKEASLRRAVSTAYYALFHLLINEAVGNWRIDRQRSVLARTFEQGNMKQVCENCVKNYYLAREPAAGLRLKEVAKKFCELQQARHIADYDNSFVWTRVEAESCIRRAATAFKDLRAIRMEDQTQDFLLALFLPKLPRE